MNIDGSFLVTVDRTAWGDVSLSLVRHDLRIDLDPAEAARVCREIWSALGAPDLGMLGDGVPPAAVSIDSDRWRGPVGSVRRTD